MYNKIAYINMTNTSTDRLIKMTPKSVRPVIKIKLKKPNRKSSPIVNQVTPICEQPGEPPQRAHRNKNIRNSISLDAERDTPNIDKDTPNKKRTPQKKVPGVERRRSRSSKETKLTPNIDADSSIVKRNTSGILEETPRDDEYKAGKSTKRRQSTLQDRIEDTEENGVLPDGFVVMDEDEDENDKKEGYDFDEMPVKKSKKKRRSSSNEEHRSKERAQGKIKKRRSLHSERKRKRSHHRDSIEDIIDKEDGNGSANESNESILETPKAVDSVPRRRVSLFIGESEESHSETSNATTQSADEISRLVDKYVKEPLKTATLDEDGKLDLLQEIERNVEESEKFEQNNGILGTNKSDDEDNDLDEDVISNGHQDKLRTFDSDKSSDLSIVQSDAMLNKDSASVSVASLIDEADKSSTSIDDGDSWVSSERKKKRVTFSDELILEA